MLDKETFVKYIKQIMKQYDAINELYDDFTRLFGNFEGMVSEVMSVDLPIKILAEAMDDRDEWIEYFIYECDCGREKKEIKWWDGDEEETEFIETLEQLYDAIIKSHNSVKPIDATANGFYVPTPEELEEIYNYVVSNAKDKKEN